MLWILKSIVSIIILGKAVRVMAEEKDYKAQAEKDIEDVMKKIEGFSKNIKKSISTISLSATLSIFNIKENVKSLVTDFDGTFKEAGKHIKDNINDALKCVCDKGKSGIKSLAVSGLSSISKLKDSVKEKFSEIDLFGSAIELGKKGISGMISLSKSLGNVLSKALSSAVGIINYDWSSLAESFSGCDSANSKAEKMQTNSDGINNSVTSIKAGLFDTVADPLVDATGQVDEIISGISSEFLENGVPALGEVIVIGVSQILDVINGMLPEFVDSIIEIIMSITTAINEYLSSDETSSGIVESVSGILTTFISAILEVLPSLVETGLLLMQTLLEAIQTSIPNLIPVAQETLTTIITTLIENLPGILQTGMQILVSIIDGITQMLPNLIPLAISMILNIVTTILGNLDKIIASAVQLILALVQGIVNALPKLIDEFPKMIITICTAIINNLPSIINAAINIIEALISGLISAIPKLVQSIPDIIKAIVNAFGNANWGVIGTNCIKGIGEGLKSGIKALLNIVKDVVDSVIGGFKSLFGIHSPSRVMRDIIGKNLIKGISVGIDVESPNLISNAEVSMQDLVSRMKSAVEFESIKMIGNIEGLSRYTGTLSSIVNNNDNGIVQNITITQPVKSPSETARAIRRAGRELAFG